MRFNSTFYGYNERKDNKVTSRFKDYILPKIVLFDRKSRGEPKAVECQTKSNGMGSGYTKGLKEMDAPGRE